MNQLKASMAGVALALFASSAMAGKVNIPKSGDYEFKFCLVGEAKIMSSGDKVYVSHYSNVANVLTTPPGKAFDRMSSLCHGTFANLNGKMQDFGVCELTDADGDKWWMEYHGSTDGSGGTYTAVHGTGKYDGMTLSGQYILDFWPAAMKDGFQACNANKGSYRLK